MADEDLTIEEILLRCRQVDGGGEGSAETPVESQEAPAETATEAPAEPAAAPAKIDPSKMSVEDMLAAARASASGESAAAPAAPAKPAAKPAASANTATHHPLLSSTQVSVPARLPPTPQHHY